MLTLVRWAVRIALLGFVVLACWVAMDSVVRPLSTLMLARMAAGRPVDRRWVPLSSVSPRLVAAVILSEDGQFCRNPGVDWRALREVLHGGLRRPSRGASTMTMQVAKNLFLWPGRSYLRKAVEIPLALVLNVVWTKKQLMDYYLNIAEWGDGTFGVEAAAQRYFHVGAKDLSSYQAALLATALPNPFLRKPDHPTRLHRALADRILRLLPDAPSHTGCLQ